MISPRWFFSGRILTMTMTHEPSGRSMWTSASRASGILPDRTSAMGHCSWGMKVPSGRCNLYEPQKRSSVSPGLGVRPHNSVARGLKSRITPEALQE